MAKWLELLRTGTFKDRHGETYTITADTIKTIAGNYDADTPPQIVVGHPGKAVVPSFGIVDKLKAAGDRLLFMPGKVVAEFESLVKKGAFQDVSAGLDRALTKLGHVAFLSAQKPAIDGLAPICEFESPEGEESINLNTVTITDEFKAEFSSPDRWWIKWRLSDIGTLFRKMRENIIEKDGVDAADKMIPGYLVDNISAEPPQETVTEAQFSHLEGAPEDMEFKKLYEESQSLVTSLQAKNAEFSTQITQLTTDNAKLKTQVEAVALQSKEAEFSAFVEDLIAKKQMLPDGKKAAVENLLKMYKASGAEFSADDSPLSLYKAQLAAHVVAVPGGEHTADNRGAEFSAFGNSPMDIAAKAGEYIKTQAALGAVVSPTQAVNRIVNNQV